MEDSMQNVTISDDDETPLTQETDNRNKTEKPAWNLFQKDPPDKDKNTEKENKFYNLVIMSMKMVTYLITFAIVLSGSVIAKSIVLLMTSQLQTNRTTSYCYSTFEDRQFISYSTLEERISWTWAILFVFIVPEVQTFLRSIRIWIFKGQKTPSLIEFLVPLLFETFHTVGLALLVFMVLPTMDAVQGVMLTNGLCLVSGILGMLSRKFDDTWVFKCGIDICAIIFQISALFVWPWFTLQKPSDRPWLLPIAAVLVSFGWWENFVNSTSIFKIVRQLDSIKEKLRSCRYFTYTFISLWKMAIFLLSMSFCVWINEEKATFTTAFKVFDQAFSQHNIQVQEKRPAVLVASNPGNSIEYLQSGSWSEYSDNTSVQYAMIVQIVAAYVSYITAKFACRICIQTFSFSFPIMLSVPVTIVTIVTMCGIRETDTCFWNGVMPGYLFWTCPQGDVWQEFFVKENSWVWILLLFSQSWIAIHIWTPADNRLASTETIFASPMYNSILVDQSLAFNRRQDEDSIEINEMKKKSSIDLPNIAHSANNDNVYSETNMKKDTIPMIYACATMWHEEEDEMVQMLKSIFRMDSDQSAYRVARSFVGYQDPRYYNFETHIFFDDAFTLKNKKDAKSFIINKWVKSFLDALNKAVGHIHQESVKLATPTKIPTPYGGRLEWVLPGGTKLILHLKDSLKIRKKKRWSQVMYMYYLLGHKLMESSIPDARKEVIAANTYILALDGDIDFQPKAVELLVDRMKINKNLGAACGRIHPTGSGPMVWYQQFEYAIGHWLQKATEHVFGCVLCSPGCFSLFRAKALMDNNVVAKYTTMSTEARHCVQFDQGEDRWLCTLILQQGYRIEYCAASDAQTHAPEGFAEFFKQRRRWIPSTMANIMDLLQNYEKVVHVNPDISYFYIFYQIIMMVGTILGPGTIFLMLVGAFATAFNLDQWTSFLYNFIPLLFFILVCRFCKGELQLVVAQILSVIYALAMVAVVVAITLQVADDGLLAPSSLFLVAVASTFIIAGFIHPLEISCLFHGFLYYITIPSMYLLLMIYSVFNMNDVSWGTRAGPITEELGVDEDFKDKKDAKLSETPVPVDKKENRVESSIELCFSGLYKLLCCGKEAIAQQTRTADSLQEMSKQIQYLHKSINYGNTSGVVTIESQKQATAYSMNRILEEPAVYEKQTNNVHVAPVVQILRDDMMNPLWMEDKQLRDAVADFLTGKEIRFWNELIKEYLEPLDEDKEKEKMTGKLVDLKNSISFAFLMMNAVFVILVFLLQLEKESIHVNWPFGANHNVSYVPVKTSEVHVSIEYLELEPIGLVFVGFFGIILLTQFIGMLIHRFGTFSHILAATTIEFCTRTPKTADSTLKENVVSVIKKLQMAKHSSAASIQNHAGRRPTIANLSKHKYKKKEVDNLETIVRRNYKSFAVNRRNSKLFTDQKSHDTLAALKEGRRKFVERRKSVTIQRKGLIPDYMRNSTPRSSAETFSEKDSVFHSWRSTRTQSLASTPRETDHEEYEMQERL